MQRSIKGKRRPVRGMTLLEVVMAVAVISIAIMGTYSAWVNSQRLQALQKEEAKVQALLSRYMNDIRSMRFDTVSNNMGTTYQGGYYIPMKTIRADGIERWDGYSGGEIDPTSDRLRPGKIKLYMGWDGKGTPNDAMLRGVKVSPTAFTGGIQYGNAYWAPQMNTPELRIVFINNELPNESEFGVDPEINPGDGLDLNGDGRISTLPMDPSQANALYDFGEVDAKPLFPRYLAIPIHLGRPYQNAYIDPTRMVVCPVVLQARWWSMAGMPREITLITFITNRAGTGVN